MSNLARQHRDLSPMMGVVSDKVGDEAGYIGTKSFDPAVVLQGLTQDDAESFTAVLQGPDSLYWRGLGAIELLGNAAIFGGSLEPHNTDVVHVGHDDLDGATLILAWFCFPGSRRKVIDQVLIYAVIGVEGVEQRYW